MKKQKIRLGNGCNYQCFYCREYGRKEVPVSLEQVTARCEAAVLSGAAAVEFGGGEPLLYPELAEAIRRAKAVEGIRHVSIFTNGSLLKSHVKELKEAGLDEINLHMDVPDASAYARITGRSQILNGILDIIWSASVKDMALTITVYLHKESKPYLGVMAGLAKKFDVTICFVELPDHSEDCGLNEESVVKLLRKSFPDLEKKAEQTYGSSQLKGRIAFETLQDCM